MASSYCVGFQKSRALCFQLNTSGEYTGLEWLECTARVGLLVRLRFTCLQLYVRFVELIG